MKTLIHILCCVALIGLISAFASITCFFSEKSEKVKAEKEVAVLVREIKRKELEIVEKRAEFEKLKLETEEVRFKAWLKAYSSGEYMNQEEDIR